MTAIAVERSHNAKLGDCSATYAGQSTCPADCPLLGHGCYAEMGYVGAITRRLNATKGHGSIRAARLEARAIARLSGRRFLRLHVVGDCRTNAAAQILAAACRAYDKRGGRLKGRKVWTYTHAWRQVARESWGQISVLASCESVAQARQAMAKGYAAAVIVPGHDSAGTYVKDGLTLIACPHQTRKTQCADCRLCLHDDRLLAQNAAIAFAAHGMPNMKKKVLARLEVVS